MITFWTGKKKDVQNVKRKTLHAAFLSENNEERAFPKKIIPVC